MKLPADEQWVQAQVPPFNAFANFLGYQLHKAAGRFYARQYPYLSEFGLVPPQYGILLGLREVDGSNQLNLGRQLGIDKASMVRFLDGLEQAGYARRSVSPQDRRARLVFLTEAGRTVCNQLEQRYQAAECELLAVLSEVERQELIRLVGKLNQV